MKLNWGTGIALVYATFAIGMVGAVFASRKHDPGLVAKDYYDLDLHYQARLVEKQNTATLSKKLEINHLRPQGQLSLQFPLEAGQPTGGTVKIYRGATAEGERQLPVQADASGQMQIPVAGMQSGRWRMEVIWQAGGKSYFQESAVEI